jgi:hypothetical protein
MGGTQGSYGRFELARRTRVTVIAKPLHAVALVSEPVAVGLSLQPARPTLAKLVGLDPPTAVVRCGIAPRKGGSNGAHAATHAAVTHVVDR